MDWIFKKKRSMADLQFLMNEFFVHMRELESYSFG